MVGSMEGSAARCQEISPGIPGYHVLQVLRTDPLGHWYEAEEEATSRRVMLRVLFPGLAGDDGARQAFLAEAERASALHHPNLLPVLALVPGACPAVATEPSGRTLADELATGWPLGEPVALGYARDIASALAYLDGRGFAYRNLTPSVIHLRARAGARLVALGEVCTLRAFAGQRGRLSQDPRYAAPELITGPAPIDGRTGSYVLGALLFHMLVGTPPHPASSPLAMARAHLHEAFPPLEEARPEVTPAVAELCRDATVRDVLRRPHPVELVARLDRLYERATRQAPLPHRHR